VPNCPRDRRDRWSRIRRRSHPQLSFQSLCPIFGATLPRFRYEAIPRILKVQVKGRLLLSEADKATLAKIAHRLGRKALEEVAAAAMPDTILGWYRKLVANKFDGSRFRHSAGRPRVDEETERLVVQMAQENPTWGYDRIVGALANLGQRLSDQTVGNILRRHGVENSRTPPFPRNFAA
jgi:putative transposase